MNGVATVASGRKWKLVFPEPTKGRGERKMSLAEREVQKRSSVRAMLERLEPDVKTLTADRSLLTRQELFGPVTSRTEEGFQQRCLRRMCEMRLLDTLVAYPTRTRVYAVRDSSKVLDALTDDEALTRVIWHRPEIDLSVPEPSASVPNPPPSAPPEPAPSAPEVLEGRTTTSVLAELASASGDDVQALTLKVLAGMVESLYYLRTKVEDIDRKLDALSQGAA